MFPVRRSMLTDSLGRFVEHFGLRYVKRRKCYLGVYRGLCLDVSEFDGNITLQFFSPTADIQDQVLENFAGFHHWSAAGLPVSWIRGRVLRGDHVDEHGCLVVIDGARLEQIGFEQFLEVPDLIAGDLEELGATKSLLCVHCAQRPATVVGLLNWCYSWSCNDCWRTLATQATNGGIPVTERVNWAIATPTLAVSTILGGLGWGAIQQPGQHIGFYSLLLLPVLWGFGLCALLGRLRVGINRWLRLAICSSLILSVVAGNVWGFSTVLSRQLGPVDWMNAAWLYFTVQLAHNIGNEAPFLIGGLVGAWIHSRLLRSFDSIKVE